MTINKDTGFLNLEEDPKKQILRRQEKPSWIARNGAAIYITKTPLLSKFILGGNILPYFMDLRYSIDIDHSEDLLIASALLQSMNID